MNENIMKEWFLDVPWGRLAVLSWGSRVNPPVLLVHGHLDSAATFVPLVASMPRSYYYVSFDLPGSGRSDAFPGPPITYMHYVEAMRQVVVQLHLDSFYCIAHCLGYIVTSFYNAAFPGQIRRLAVIAGLIAIGCQGVTDMPTYWIQNTYEKYFQRYYLSPQQSTVTYEEAISVLAKARDISKAMAAVLATRCLEHTSDGKVRFTWHAKTKSIFSPLIANEILCAVLSVNTPTLCFVPTEDKTPVPIPEYTAMILKGVKNKCELVDVPGGHSVHLTNPESIVPRIVRFFDEGAVSAKL